MSATVSELIQEYKTYCDGPPDGMWKAPTAREEAGRCLAADNPTAAIVAVVPRKKPQRGYWADVGKLICDALANQPSFAGHFSRFFVVDELYDACVEMLSALAEGPKLTNQIIARIGRARDRMTAVVDKGRGDTSVLGTLEGK